MDTKHKQSYSIWKIQFEGPGRIVGLNLFMQLVIMQIFTGGDGGRSFTKIVYKSTCKICTYNYYC